MGKDCETAYRLWWQNTEYTASRTPLLTALLYLVCDNDTDKFMLAESMLERAFSDGFDAAK
jgi:hypothetical protein